MAHGLDPKPIPLITWQNMAPPFLNHVYFQNQTCFPFQTATRQFSLINAWWLSEAALLSYAEPDFAEPRFQKAGFDKILFLSGRSTQCYVATQRRLAIVAFRGTQCKIDQGPGAMADFIADLGVDIDIRRVNAPGGGKSHRGFHQALDEVWEELHAHLKELARQQCTLWLTGHSLGGALAVLTASRFSAINGIYTFGAPRVGNRDFVAHHPTSLFCFANNNDVVPHLPLFPYVDQGEQRYFDSHGFLHNQMDRWQRWKDEIHGHIQCLAENVKNLKQDLTATLPDGLKDHTPLLYALHTWNNLIAQTSLQNSV